MKSVIIPVLSACALAAAAAGAQTAVKPAALTGVWHVHESIMGNEADLMCTFTQAGPKLGGSCISDQGTSPVSGTLQDATLTWTINSQYNGDPLTLTYTATLDSSGKVAGSVDVEPYAVQGDFTAEPVKQPAAAPVAAQ